MANVSLSDTVKVLDNRDLSFEIGELMFQLDKS